MEGAHKDHGDLHRTSPRIPLCAPLDPQGAHKPNQALLPSLLPFSCSFSYSLLPHKSQFPEGMFQEEKRGVCASPLFSRAKECPKTPSSSRALMDNRAFSSPLTCPHPSCLSLPPFQASVVFLSHLAKTKRGVGCWVSGGEPGIWGLDFQGITNPLGNPAIAPLLIWSHEKQLPVNKQEQKLGSVFKVMSYVENMFRGALNVPVKRREVIVPDALALEGSL